MRIVKRTRKFREDVERLKKRGRDLSSLKSVIEKLYKGKKLEFSRYKPHKLLGKYKDCWECHIKNDWLLVWFRDEDSNLVLVRTGSHSDLFE
ncbi:MAG: type II toxin-antitoxin system YafQ family toxin [Candidatus Magasanikbacteria bacterium]